jgi:hypothetical protein
MTENSAEYRTLDISDDIAPSYRVAPGHRALMLDDDGRHVEAIGMQLPDFAPEGWAEGQSRGLSAKLI